MAEGNKRRHFTNEYKKNAVKLVTEKGLPVGKEKRCNKGVRSQYLT